MKTATRNSASFVQRRMRILARHAMDVVLVSLSAMVSLAGYYGQEISFYMASV